MKNQYFGDINDYRKYGLLRAISGASKLHTTVAWMLTPDDRSTDGKFTNYLLDTERWSKYDPELFFRLKQILHAKSERRVKHFEDSGLLEEVEYYSKIIPDKLENREDWFDELLAKTKNNSLVFLDPDNGLEVRSRPYGKKNSSKYLYWREVEELWKTGSSLLIYQHYIREKRDIFVRRILQSLQEKTNQSLVGAFSTSNVVFLLALQPDHHCMHKAIVESVQKSWDGQITEFKLS